jgi:hypothetical protein
MAVGINPITVDPKTSKGWGFGKFIIGRRINTGRGDVITSDPNGTLARWYVDGNPKGNSPYYFDPDLPTENTATGGIVPDIESWIWDGPLLALGASKQALDAFAKGKVDGKTFGFVAQLHFDSYAINISSNKVLGVVDWTSAGGVVDFSLLPEKYWMTLALDFHKSDEADILFNVSRLKDPPQPHNQINFVTTDLAESSFAAAQYLALQKYEAGAN